MNKTKKNLIVGIDTTLKKNYDTRRVKTNNEQSKDLGV